MTEQPKRDDINHPQHYASQGGIECIEVLEQLARDGEDFRILAAMKYLWRYRHKGTPEKDLRKAVWYITRKIEEQDHEQPLGESAAAAPTCCGDANGVPWEIHCFHDQDAEGCTLSPHDKEWLDSIRTAELRG